MILAYSPCPNDTYVFHAWVTGLLPEAPEVEERLLDIDALNELAHSEGADVCKISFHAFGHLRDRYALLHSGGALGRGCGPLLVSRGEEPAQPLRDPRALAGLTIAIPGHWTTAALLLRLFAPEQGELRVMPYDEIMPAVAAGGVDAGLIIHESRFTYPAHGLSSLMDLGAWWEEETGHPIPLGAIAVRRDLGEESARRVERSVRASLEHARTDPAASRAYIERHAQELDPDVCRRHIDLYVTEYSLDYGDEGEAAIRDLLRRGEQAGAFGPSPEKLFWDR